MSEADAETRDDRLSTAYFATRVQALVPAVALVAMHAKAALSLGGERTCAHLDCLCVYLSSKAVVCVPDERVATS